MRRILATQPSELLMGSLVSCESPPSHAEVRKGAGGLGDYNVRIINRHGSGISPTGTSIRAGAFVARASFSVPSRASGVSARSPVMPNDVAKATKSGFVRSEEIVRPR